MSDLKPIYLMAGGRGSHSHDPIMQAVFSHTGKLIPSIAYVGVASGDDWGFYQMMSNMMRKTGKCQVNRVVITPKKADLQKAKDLLQSADAVFMSGGDVEAGMQVIEDKGLKSFFHDLYRQGKVFFGASAGSIILAREWVRWTDPDDDSSAELFPCLGLAPVLCDTHAEEDDWVELKVALKLKENGSEGYGIPTGSCLVVFPDGQLKPLAGAIARYSKREKRVVKQEELK